MGWQQGDARMMQCTLMMDMDLYAKSVSIAARQGRRFSMTFTIDVGSFFAGLVAGAVLVMTLLSVLGRE